MTELRVHHQHISSQQTRGVDPNLSCRWGSDVDDGPTSAQHWANASCLLVCGENTFDFWGDFEIIIALSFIAILYTCTLRNRDLWKSMNIKRHVLHACRSLRFYTSKRLLDFLGSLSKRPNRFPLNSFFSGIFFQRIHNIFPFFGVHYKCSILSHFERPIQKIKQILLEFFILFYVFNVFNSLNVIVNREFLDI